MSLEAISAYVTAQKGTIYGKKAFQKIMYFITEKGVPTGLTYRIYHFGPYSSELDYQTDDLVMQGAIQVEQQGDLPVSTFLIKPGSMAEGIVNGEKSNLAPYVNLIDSVLSVLPKEPKTLELWSTTHFVVQSKRKFGDEVTQESVVESVKDIKGDKFTVLEIQGAYKELLNSQLLS